MFALTRQERLVVLFLVVIIFTGTALHYLFKQNPRLDHFLDVLENERLYRRLDLNKASYEELLNLPSIGPVTAKRILAYREENGPFSDVAEIKDIEGIKSSSYEKLSKFLKVSR